MKQKKLSLYLSFLFLLASCGNIEPNSEPTKVKEPSSTPAYTVTWKDEDGTILEVDRNVASGTNPSFDHSEPTKASGQGYQYSFSGWEPSLSPVTKDVTYTARYQESRNQYTVTWKNEDGTVLSTSNVSYGAMPSYTGKTPTKKSTPQYRYQFKGWYPKVQAIKGNATYTAQYEAVAMTYTVTWKNYDGTVLKTDSNVPYGVVPSYSGATPIRQTDYTSSRETRYTFSGWTTEVSPVTQDITYTAAFTSAQYDIYTISYDLDGGTLTGSNPATYTTTDCFTIDHEPTRTGYTFLGWTGSNGEIPQKNVGVISGTTGNLSYRANWQANTYTVTLDSNGGTISTTAVRVTFDSSYMLPDATPENGYLFAGWFDDGGNQYDGTKYTYPGDITLTAHYTCIGYSISYDLDGGTNDSGNPSTYTIEDTVTLKAPKKSMHLFLGWTGSNGETPQKEVMIAKGTTGNLSYRANWELPTYSVGDTFTFGTYPQTTAGTDRTPISWKVLSADNTNHKYLVVSEKVLDQVQYYTSTSNRTVGGKTVYANNYKYSTLRAFLNGYDGSSYSVSNYTGKGFLDTAFTAEEKSMIMTTTVDNSPASMGDSSNPYVCDDTSDKVFALSYSEATNSSYGFSSSGGRLAYATDYAKQKGVYVNGGALYWLRSPDDDNSNSARLVRSDGGIYNRNVYSGNVGVRPAFRIKIS